MSRDAFEAEKLDDPPDHADAFALLDGIPVRPGYCPSCCQWTCSCDDWGQEPARERWRRPAPRVER